MNLVIALSWMLSLLNQLHIDLEENLWKRFPYHCSYCGGCPCTCKAERVTKRVVKRKASTKRRPQFVGDVQHMFMEIYPADTRTLEHAGIHLAEEVGELSEAVLKFRGNHTDADFEAIAIEAADVYSCFMGVFNSFGFDYEENVKRFFKKGCRTCESNPCVCTYRTVMSFKS